MPIDKQALADFIGSVRADEAKYKGSAAKFAAARKVIAATGEGTGQRHDLMSAIAGIHGISESPDANKFAETRTAEMLRGLISEAEINHFIDGPYPVDEGLQKMAALLYERLGKLGVNEKFRGEFLGDVMNRFEAKLANRR